MASPMLDRPLLDINAVAEYLNVSEDTVRRMIARGVLPVVQFDGSKGQTIRIRPESLQRVLSRWETRTR
jgi:excisionase family DNA binding protein